MTTPPDRIERAALGDEEARASLVSEHRPVAFRPALSILGDRDAAEDVSQEAMVRLHTALPGFRGDSELATWVYRIALNLAYDQLRRVRSGHVPLSEAIGQAGAHLEPERSIDAERAREAVASAIDRLPERLRETLILRFLSGLTYRDIARATGTSEGTVASRIYRGLKQLGSEVEPKHLEILE